MIAVKLGGMAVLITIAFRNIFRNMRRTMFYVVASAIAVFFIIFYSSSLPVCFRVCMT